MDSGVDRYGEREVLPAEKYHQFVGDQVVAGGPDLFLRAVGNPLRKGLRGHGLPRQSVDFGGKSEQDSLLLRRARPAQRKY